ncbi:hypothetical protein [Sulfitobacter alexandrii]|nr:hypothetical protein [Sulfitobacter alexandrii]
MLRTITIGSCISVQGIFVGNTPNGQMTVQVDDKIYSGKPVNRTS